MPLAATRAPYTLFIVDDDMPLNPREDCDCLGKMLCWHGRYSLGEKHDFEEPRDFLQELLFSEYSSGHDRDNPVFAFLKSGKAKDAKLEYNRSTREWELLENQRWTSESDWYVSSSYAASLKDDVPDWFLDDCLSALSTGELFSLVEQMEGMVILPLYLYDHSGITMNTTGFSCPWDSGQVGWIYADKRRIEAEYGKVTPETVEKACQVLEGEVKSYDYFLTGQCYGFQLFREDVEVDSCWGFLGEIRDVQDDVKDYLPEDCRWVEFIKCMRRAGIQIEALIEYVSLFQQGDETQAARKQILIEQRALLQGRIEEMQQTLAYLDRKIDHYEQWNPVLENDMLSGNGQ